MKKILLVGPFYVRAGYGEMARFALRALREHEDKLDIYLEPIIWGQTGWIFDYLSDEYQWMQSLRVKTENYVRSGGQFDLSIQITIPNEFKKLAPVNIGYTAGIETVHISPAWLQPSNIMDKIIVISEHAKSGFVNTIFQDQAGNAHKVQPPVEVVHLPYRECPAEPLELNLTTDTNFLCVNQWGPRKNIEQLLVGFFEAFKEREDVGLILKTNQAADNHIDRVKVRKALENARKSFPNAKCKLYMLHGTLTDGQMKTLYTHPTIKAFVTTTHGEGFGMPIFEAVCNDLPVIAPNWSGHLDFLKIDGKEMFCDVKYDLKQIQPDVVWQGVMEKETAWCYPDMFSLKKRMSEVASGELSRIKARAVKLGKHVRETFAQRIINNSFIKSLFGEEYIAEASLTVDQLPKISIITSVFNGDEHIEGFMKDIVGQTIFKEKCELVMVNCNSQGNEEEVIKRYQELYPNNIKYIKLDNDPGIYAAWNLAIRESTGEFVTNANLDDRKSPEFMEKLAKKLLSTPDCDVVYAKNKMTTSPNETWESNSSNSVYPSEEWSLDAMLRGNPPHCMPMWRKSLHQKNGYFEEKYRSASDWEFWLRCSFAGHKMTKYGKPLGLYYFNPKGMSTNQEHNSWKRQEEREIFKKYLDMKRQREQ